MNTTRKSILTVLLLALCYIKSFAIDVVLLPDKGIASTAPISGMQNNLAALLTEINEACSADRPLNLSNIRISAEAKQTLAQLWVVSHFKCDDEEVTDRLWNFKNSYMARNIPLIIVPDAADKWANGTFQDAVVEFDKQGTITDFCYSFSSRTGESFEKCSDSNDIVDIERKMQIVKWCDAFATAYNRHDMAFMQKIFSDKALIITGRVVQETNKEFATSNEKVEFTKQTKKQYLAKLARCFNNNKWINVEFTEVGINGCQSVTRSKVNKNFYGVRLHQKWRSSHYNDDGYVFILWNFTDEDEPKIEVRTWQPDIVGGKKVKEDDIISLGDFEEDIVDM